MIPTNFHTVGPTLQALPLALIFSTQLLLAEKSSVREVRFTSDMRNETLTTRATVVTPILEEIRGWIHGGLND